jgi:glycyl-tRNA synthetase beta chain
MPDLVFELGTEEMPAGAIADALEQLREKVTSGLAAARLAPEKVETFGTPRRLVVLANGVPAQQPDQEREVRGPAKSVAFDAAGKPTGAALGFAKKQGVDAGQLEIVDVDGSEYVQARVRDTGRVAEEVVGPILADIAKSLAFPKLMRWGDQSAGGMRFVRPIRWLLCLLDEKIVPMEVAGIRSGRETRGHRFLAPGEFEVGEALDLFQMLHTAGVMLDPEERKRGIVAQANMLAAEAGGRVPWDEGLLEENVFLVEWPTGLRGNFDPAYLELPRPVLVTAMKKHQRFFPVEDENGKLLPHFISIRNGGEDHLDTVREGNERVLTARFADARFFYSQDQETKLDDMAAQLGRLVFQEKLGTIAQKRERLVALVGSLADSLRMDSQAKERAIRAASLCKADLVSRMVIELPSLQGVMGREYALLQDEDPAVADAIAQHYQPKSANDSVPASPLGCLLAVADRLDTLVGYVGIGVMPSGSSDPYGLRRAAQGVVQILADEPGMGSLTEMERLAADAYDQVNGLDVPLEPLLNDLGALFDQRISALHEERGVRYDLVDATLGGGSLSGAVVFATVKRGETLQAVAGDASFVPTTQAAARVANILKSAPADERRAGNQAILEVLSRRVDRTLLQEGSELRLFHEAQALAPDVARLDSDRDYAGLYRELERLREPVNAFFEDVMVMVEDAGVRANRLALLSLVDALYKALADFTKVVVA